MVRVRRRLAWLVLAVVIFQGAIGTARAQATRRAADEEVTVLVAPVPPPPPPSAATIEPPADLSRFVGQPLAAVDVVLDEERFADDKPPVVSVMRPGDRLTAALVRRAMEEALASGHFAGARVSLAAEPGGVRATIRLSARKVIDSVRLELHGAPVNGDDLLREADLAAEGELVLRDVPKHRERIEAMLGRRGFQAPQVTLSTRPTDDPLRVVVLVDVQAGAPRRIERRVLYGVGGARPDTEMAERTYAVAAGERADEYTLETADADLQMRIRARGFLRAEISHDVVLHRGIVVLRVRIDFGTRYETRYEGNDTYDKSTLDDVLDLEGETDRSPNHLLQRVREYYVKHGFLDADVRLEDRGGPNDAVHFLVFHVVENRRVSVAARSYPCLREADVKKLGEGGPTSASAIGREVDSYLEEELPGNELLVPPRVNGLDQTLQSPLAQKGARPAPLELDPDTAYAPETYERAVGHVQELYRSEGFLSAQVGPVQVLRRTCDPRSPPGECRPLRIPAPPDVCTYDATGVPLPVPPLEPGSTCEPDPARGTKCEARVWLRIPVKLGPRTQLWDVAFTGAAALAPAKLAEVADVRLGSWASAVKVDEARRRVTDAYKEEGYAFVDVKSTLEQSPDRTRARVRFTIAEGEKVMVRAILIRGNVATHTGAIQRRVALSVGQPYRASDVRKTEERIATLGAFSSVSVGLENPYVPERQKTVLITVVERPSQYTEVAPGFSTGEGFRLAAEYGHRNLWGNAVQLTLRLQLAYIPTPLIIDATARGNYRDLPFVARLAVRATGSMVFPEIGLGPLVRAGVDGILVHDLQPDFYLTKVAAIPNVNWRPVGELNLTLFQSFEVNNNHIFQSGTIQDYLQSLSAQGQNVTDLVRQLLVPDGESYVFSQRMLASWDRRDNAFNATRGTYVVTGIEHVDGFPVTERNKNYLTPPQESHFFKLTQTVGGYVPLGPPCPPAPQNCRFLRGIRVATLTRVGGNLQIASNSATYPDRLFFMGGVDSMRGWNLNSFIPQDYVDLIEADKNKPDFVGATSDPYGVAAVPNTNKVTATSRPIRGGNLMANERLELRIPLSGPFETVLFGDIGNLWIDIGYPFDHGSFPMRADVGSGLRVQTPVGPLAVDYGINVTRHTAYEDFGAFNFAIGLF